MFDSGGSGRSANGGRVRRVSAWVLRIFLLATCWVYFLAFAIAAAWITLDDWASRQLQTPIEQKPIPDWEVHT